MPNNATMTANAMTPRDGREHDASEGIRELEQLADEMERREEEMAVQK